MRQARFGLKSYDRGNRRATLAILGAFVLLGQILLTQWTATVLSSWHGLGPGWFRLGGTEIYAPWAWASWASVVPARYLPQFRSFVLLSLGAPMLVTALLDKTRRVATEHGSARWAGKGDLTRAGLLRAVVRGGVYVGAWRNRWGGMRYLRHDGPEHVLAFAPTRSGKGVGLVIPTLLSWRESAVVLDIKGENWDRTAGWRVAAAGQRVIRFDPSDPKSAKFNPLGEIRLATVHEIADAQNVATMIVDPEGKGVEENHWTQTAWSLLVGSILHVCYRERRRGAAGTLGQVADELCNSESGDLMDIVERWLQFDHAGVSEGWQGTFGPSNTHPVVAATAREMRQRSEKEASSVLSAATRYLTLYRDPVITAATAASDFRVSDLLSGDTPLTVYLVIAPPDLNRVRPLLRLMLDQIVRGLTAELPEHATLRQHATAAGPRKWFARDGGATPKPAERRVLLMLDEFAALGKMHNLQHSLAHCAGYGVKAYLIVQDLAQLFAAYGRDESIVANCHIRVAFAPNNVRTAELLSKMTGTTTVEKRTGGSGRRQNTAHGRALLTADECMRLRLPQKSAGGRMISGDALIFVAGHPPIYGRQILYFEDAVLAARAAVPAPSSRVAAGRPALSEEERRLTQSLLGTG